MKKVLAFFNPNSIPKFSLERLNYLFTQLNKNKIVTPQNAELVIETLRSIAELMIWGDQHNHAFWDFFLEKNILSYFLNILKQKCSSHVKKQLIQTLSIMIQNVENKDSLYFLMSQNHIDQIINHRFDFENEELLAYYITFLKTIALKLDENIIQLFFNRELHKFPLYTESARFYNSNENMVRIAVRTITLSIYSVKDNRMRDYVLDVSKDTYFVELPWFIRHQFVKLDQSAKLCAKGKLSLRVLEDQIAEQLDHLYYLNDIFQLNIDSYNQVLHERLYNILLEPFLVKSIICPEPDNEVEQSKPFYERVTFSRPLPALPEEKSANASPVLPSNDSSHVNSNHNSTSPSDSVSTDDIKLDINVESLMEENNRRLSTTGHTHGSNTEVKRNFLELRKEARDSRLVSQMTAMFFLAQVFLVYVHTPLIQELGQMLLIQPSNSEELNLYRETIFSGLLSEDESVLSVAVSLVYAIISNREDDDLKNLLFEAGIEPRRMRKTHRLLDALTSSSGGNSSKRNSKKKQSVQMDTDASDTIKVRLIPLQTKKNTITVKFDFSKQEIPRSVSETEVADGEAEEDYAFDLVGLLFHTLEVKIPRRIITVHLIMRLLVELLSPNKDDPLVLHPSHLNMLKNSFTQATIKAQKHIQDLPLLDILSLWEYEYTQFMNLKTLNAELLLADCSLLLPHMTEDLADEFEYYKREPLNSDEELQSDLHTYLVFNYLLCCLQSKHRDRISELLDMKPLYVMDQEIVLSTKECLKFFVLETKRNGAQSPSARYLFFEGDFMYIVVPLTTKVGHGQIRDAVPLLYVTTHENGDTRFAMKCKAERKRNNQRMQKIFDEVFMFDDASKCSEAKVLIDTHVVDVTTKKKTQIESLLLQNTTL